VIVDLLARSWGAPSGAPDGMAQATAFLAWTLADLGHRVRCHGEREVARWARPGLSWHARPGSPVPIDWQADLVISSTAASWRKLAVAAGDAGARSRVALWHHYGTPPSGYGCRLALPTPGEADAREWDRVVVLPPSTWALDQAASAQEAPPPAPDGVVLVPSAARVKGGHVALAVARLLPAVRFLVLAGRATVAEVADWRGLPNVEILEGVQIPSAYLDRAAAVISPTVAETYGLTVAEAAARGARVVCSNLPGPRHALGEGTGAIFLAQTAPIAQWADAIVLALRSPARPLRLRPYRETVAEAIEQLAAGAPAAAPAPARAVDPARHATAGRMRPAPSAPPAPSSIAAASPGSRLHLGCGGKRIPGWINSDAVAGRGDVVIDLRRPNLPADTFRAIYASHVLEHVHAEETPAILAHLAAALEPGGTLRISVPDLRLVVDNCINGHAYGGEASALSVLFGGDYSARTADPDRHRQAFWRERLERLLLEAGLVNVRAWRPGQYPEIDALADFATHPRDARTGCSSISLNLEADRPAAVRSSAPPAPAAPPTVAAAATGPAVVDVSVLLGTVRRPELLRGCVEAIRSSLAGSRFSHEIVIAYGDAEDPALPWMREQADVVPVLGGMTGAIDAFNRGYLATVGRYVCQINDDVVILGDALARSLRHLEERRDVAGVVWRFDRGDGLGMRHEHLAGELHPNQITIRREALEAVVERLGGFWGDQAHRSDRTYGGDSALGVLCHHLGLRLDSVDGVECRDLLHEDALRARNKAAIAADHWPKWRALFVPLSTSKAAPPTATEWPRLYVPRPGMPPRRSPLAAGSPLRLLHLSLRYDGEPQDGLRRELARIGPTVEIPWYNRDPREIAATARAHRPDLVWAQIQSSAWSPEMTRSLRAALPPGCCLALWTGDVRTGGAAPVERWLAEAGAGFDLLLADSITYARKLAVDERVAAACGYLGCGIDPDLNPPADGSDPEELGAVFLGGHHRHLGGDREQVLGHLARALPRSLTIYGSGWRGSPLEPLVRPFAAQADAARIMHRAKVTISTSLFHDLERYTSDRLKRAMHAGAVVAVRRFPDMQGLGLVEGDNCIGWEAPAELVEVVRKWSGPAMAPERLRLRRAASALAAERFTWARVVEELLAIVRDWRARRGMPA